MKSKQFYKKAHIIPNLKIFHPYIPKNNSIVEYYMNLWYYQCMETLNRDQQKSVRVLLVDDDVTFAKLVQVILKRFQQRTFVVIWKDSVEGALAEIAHNQEIDVILMDYNFPTSNGLEFCLQLDQMGRFIPIIFLTGFRDFKLAVEAMKLGVEDFLLKDDLKEVYLPRTILNTLDRVHLRKHKQAVEKRLSMAESRAQAIRELVVTVCHEFNNPLAAVKISYDLLQRQNLETVQPEVMKSFENRFNTIDSEIKRLRDLNFEKIDFHGSHSDNV
ncbi:MAG: response regulator [Bacteroidota bacterium]|jgi:FixJ family two-component response regulator